MESGLWAAVLQLGPCLHGFVESFLRHAAPLRVMIGDAPRERPCLEWLCAEISQCDKQAGAKMTVLWPRVASDRRYCAPVRGQGLGEWLLVRGNRFARGSCTDARVVPGAPVPSEQGISTSAAAMFGSTGCGNSQGDLCEGSPFVVPSRLSSDLVSPDGRGGFLCKHLH